AALEILLHARDLSRIFLVRTALEARRQAHLHLGINAAGERGIGIQVESTAAHLEQVERVIGKLLGGHPRGKWAEVLRVAFQAADARGDRRARIWIVENKLHQRRKTQAQTFVVGPGELAAQNFVEQERRL